MRDYRIATFSDIHLGHRKNSAGEMIGYSTILSRFGLNGVFVLGFFWFFDTTLKGPPEGSPFFAVLIKELSLNEKR